MKLSKLLNTNVKSLVLLVLIPILSILIIFMAWLSYDEMYRTIINGFNQKLIAISSTSGSFIDGDEHEKLAQAKEIKALSFGKDNKLYGVDSLNYFIEVNIEDGAGVRLFKFDSEINDITYNAKTELFYATSKNKIVTFNFENESIKEFYTDSSELKGLAYDTVNEYIYVSKSAEILRIDKNKEVKFITKTKHMLTSLAFDSEKKALYAIEGKTDKLIFIDIYDNKQTELTYKEFYSDSNPLVAIAFRNEKLYAGKNHLIIYDKKTKITTYKDFARGYRNEKSDIYKKYIIPMTKIKLEADLTYHYTQNLIYDNENANCIYILDVSEGNDYTPIGSEDVMDKEAIIGAENVMHRKEVFVSKIQEWEQWGLLKVAYAPILNKAGVVKAIAGADVDMGIIREKTKQALMQSSIAGIVFLIISIIAAFSISKKIIEPIRKLKYSALRIAAGRHSDKVSIKKPRELSELSSTFNTMGTKLKDTVSHLTQYNGNVLTQRKEQDLQVKLDQRVKIKHDRIRSFAFKLSYAIDGILLRNNILYFWFSNELQETSFMASKERELISTTLDTFINYEDDPLNELKEVYDALDSFGYIDLDKNTLFLHDRSKELLVLYKNEYEQYSLKEISQGLIDIENSLILSDYDSLQNITKEQIDYLLDKKYSHLEFKKCSILFAILKEEKA